MKQTLSITLSVVVDTDLTDALDIAECIDFNVTGDGQNVVVKDVDVDVADTFLI